MSKSDRCRIVAEIGANFNGSWDVAVRMLKAISKAGADTAKFQFFRAESLYPATTRVADYLVDGDRIKATDTIVDILRKTEIPDSWLIPLAEESAGCGLDVLYSVFDVDSIGTLLSAGAEEFKIASSEISHYPLLKAVGQTGKPIILSTGMCSLGDIEKALSLIGHDEVTLLHCTAAYPAPDIEVNMRIMTRLRDVFGLKVGFSDHTQDTQAAVIAVSLGAAIIEKHFTINRDLPGPDQKFSVDPVGLTQLVNQVRRAEILLGTSVKTITNHEAAIQGYTPGIFAGSTLAQGDVINGDHLVVRRRDNGEGISARHFDKVIGRRLNKGKQRGEPITWGDILYD